MIEDGKKGLDAWYRGDLGTKRKDGLGYLFILGDNVNNVRERVNGNNRICFIHDILLEM